MALFRKYGKIRGRFEAMPKPRLSAYLYTFNVDHYPVEACVRSCLGFADEVVVVDFGSWDRTREILDRLSRDPKVKIYEARWDYEEPGMDGKAKAIARSHCEGEWAFQIDADEVVPEKYWSRIRDAVCFMEEKGLTVADIGTVNFFLDLNRVCYHPDAGLFKTRLSRQPLYTHGIPIELRRLNPKGRVYCGAPTSDGTDLLTWTGERAVSEVSFADPSYNRSASRLEAPDRVKRDLLKALESERAIYVYHYGNVDLWTKLWKATAYWMGHWEMLYGKEPLLPMENLSGLVGEHIKSRILRGLPHSFEVNLEHPKGVEKWFKEGLT